MYIEKIAKGWAVVYWTSNMEERKQVFTTRKDANRFHREMTKHGLAAVIIRNYVPVA